MVDRVSIQLSIHPDHVESLQSLPWHKSLMQWKKRDAKFLEVKSGISRHVVRFVRIRQRSYAIKETSAEAAEKEFQAYLELERLHIPTLVPVGTVRRNEGLMISPTGLGPQVETRGAGYLVTRLLEYALPDSYLFKRAFTKPNRRRIWDAIVRLFVELHCKGVYWGDASLANMMILFRKEFLPEIGYRTILRAVLADSETVEFHPSLSEQMRRADVDNFLESMLWTEADMKASGVIRDPLMTSEDQEYILKRYLDLFEIEREEQKFELITHIDVDALLGPFGERGQSKAVLKHVYEHKWYLSEREGREVPVVDAAIDWYSNVFKPVLKLFSDFEVVDEFPDKTALTLYLDVMTHKYYLSERVGRDVGLMAAFEDYSRTYRSSDQILSKISGLVRAARNLLPTHMFSAV